MRLYVFKPRLLMIAWVFLFVLLATITTALAVRNDEASRPHIVGIPGPAAPTVDVEAPALLTTALEADGVAQVLLADIPYTFHDYRVALRRGAPIGTTVNLLLADPITSSGPWRYQACQGTRLVVQNGEWANITVLTATIDSQGVILELAPGRMPDPTDPTLGRWLGVDAIPNNAEADTALTAVYDADSGQEIWRSVDGATGTLAGLGAALRCPQGTNDD